MARAGAGQDLSVPLEEGALILEAAAGRAASSERALIRGLADSLRTARRGIEGGVPADIAAWLGFDPGENADLGRLLRSERLASLLGPLSDPATATSSKKYLVRAERARARFGSWYEMFPRSAWSGTSHGTLADVSARLDYVERMGFDVLYLPPIHPIGRTARKGRNAAVVARGHRCGKPLGHRID